MTETSTPRLVDAIGRALIAVTSLAESRARWEALGFRFEDEEDYAGCRAARARVEGADVCLIAAGSAGTAEPGTLAAAVVEKLQQGPGLIGWSWSVADLDDAFTAFSERGIQAQIASDGLAVIDPAHTPGAITLLEQRRGFVHDVDHPNCVTSTDHIVLMCGDAQATAAIYAEAFSLRPRIEEARGRTYAYAKVGRSLLEIVGPPEPEERSPTLWGLAMISSDLDRSAAAARDAGLSSKDPKPAVQGGRILPLPEPVDGVALAFMER
ncbi:MAG: catechol 2,3-dioxygenase-like lactoylglutathione lyase family enzyme [Hyphomicrobiaceae bacterium]|jgi:catechol 2,3-dioxygenase-like lactoylglutathione lyase family enzyme